MDRGNARRRIGDFGSGYFYVTRPILEPGALVFFVPLDNVTSPGRGWAILFALQVPINRIL
jgi:hypothetical protein